ncbi:MAG: HAD family hydrolase [Phocaeicola sp.]|uniref:HAD family hydrolase n=1 Tax=Phocaeicola TaxID=909656 RepID=UPI00234F57C1|nr:HAD family phosphatase [Phocaeicola oris]MCE2616582.1 HAD family phosphatase [Phocaeicola oris]
MDTKIKNLIFDFGGVIVDLDFSRTVNAFRAAGFFDIEEKLSTIKQDKIFFQYEVGELSTKYFRRKLRKHFSSSLFDKDIDYMWNAMLVGIPSYKLDLLLELKEKYNLYLLSNTNELHWEYAQDCLFNYKDHAWNDFFKKVYLSFQMHLDKPSPEIYQEMMKDAGIKPEESLFIDDIELNCDGARQVGLNAVQYRIEDDLRKYFE